MEIGDTPGRIVTMRAEQWSDEELVAIVLRHRGRRAEEEYLRALFGRYEARITRWCLSALGDAQDAADCVQDVLVRLYRGLHRFRRRSGFGTWVYAVTRRASIDALVMRRRREDMETSLDIVRHDRPDSSPLPSDLLLRREEECGVRSLLARHLDELEMEVVLRRYGYGEPIRRIADLLGLEGPGCVRTILKRATRRLRNQASDPWRRMPRAAAVSIGVDSPFPSTSSRRTGRNQRA